MGEYASQLHNHEGPEYEAWRDATAASREQIAKGEGPYYQKWKKHYVKGMANYAARLQGSMQEENTKKGKYRSPR